MTTTPPRSAVSPAPRWAVRAAHGAALTALPAGIWRLLLVAGYPGGYTEAGYRALGVTGWGAAYVAGLSVVTEALALLTLGLVRPWGEVLPRWVPFLAGRRVHPQAAVVPAGLGAVVLTVLWTPFVLWWAVPHPGMTALGSTIAGLLYLPLVAWGPLLGAVTWSYYRRHRAARPIDRTTPAASTTSTAGSSRTSPGCTARSPRLCSDLAATSAGSGTPSGTACAVDSE
ncbi:hypothetical protein AB0D08_34510 [Kitasatospora sp. NPDC048540]|uniref:hypothetical protein n=1 Tax=Kitasatospora sp. NPDC048540 TaxID=3155634 RepID=UPI003400D1D6